MVDFKIRRGESTTLFISPGVVNPRLIIEEGCWYLCTDTAELYLGMKLEGTLTLKKINDGGHGEPDEGGTSTTMLEFQINELKDRLDTLESFELYQEIASESDLPTDFDSDYFNPNITYYIRLNDRNICTYVFDAGSQSYMCTNSVDELVIRAMVADAIDAELVTRIEAKLPEMIADTLSSVILHGGDATPED
jgi:hypothetical protein